jgi:WD40 repeat protein
LRDTQTGDEVSLLGHTDDVLFVAFSPDGKRIVSASFDRTIRIWNSETGDMVLDPLRGHTDWVYSAVFSPDGRRIASASRDETIRIWNSETGEMVLGPLKGHTKPVYSAVFSPDGRLIASASVDHTIRIWDSRSGHTVLGPLKGHQNPVRFAVFSADGRHILSYSRDSMLVWDSETGERVPHSFEGENAKLSFTDSETAPYIITPPCSNIPVQGTSALSYSFSLDNGIVGGVVNSSVDTWLYVDIALNILIGRYTGQLILRWFT